MILLKYTKNIDYFIVNLLPYLEIYLNEYPAGIVTLYANEYLCEILKIMFGQHIILQKIKQNFHLLDADISELDIFLSRYYDTTQRLQLSKPLNPQNHQYLKSKDFICVFPKFKPLEAFHNIDQTMFNEFIVRNKLNKHEMYVIGHQFDKLNTRHGKDVDNFIDTLDFLKHCKLFITSESHWHYIALLCNCRNVIVYSSNYCADCDVLSPIEKWSSNIIAYNPFNSNVYITNNLLCDKTHKLIEDILSK
jgi:hypothetical protein